MIWPLCSFLLGNSCICLALAFGNEFFRKSSTKMLIGGQGRLKDCTTPFIYTKLLIFFVPISFFERKSAKKNSDCRGGGRSVISTWALKFRNGVYNILWPHTKVVNLSKHQCRCTGLQINNPIMQVHKICAPNLPSKHALITSAFYALFLDCKFVNGNIFVVPQNVTNPFVYHGRCDRKLSWIFLNFFSACDLSYPCVVC